MRNLNKINVDCNSRIFTSTLKELGMEDLYAERNDPKVEKMLRKFCSGKLKTPDPVERLEENKITEIALIGEHIESKDKSAKNETLIDEFFDRNKQKLLSKLEEENIDVKKIESIDFCFLDDIESDGYEITYKALEPEWKHEERVKVAEFAKELISRQNEVYALVDSKKSKAIQKAENDIDEQIKKLQEQKARLKRPNLKKHKNT